MTNDTISNGTLTIEAARHGAELQSLRRDGKEYLWQGDARYWGRRSPVLFPMVGRVWADEFRTDGHSYPMGQHGFARDSDFVRLPSPEGTLLYELRSDETTLRRFPREFALRVAYSLEASSLIVSWEVENTGSRSLSFQIGAHPAFYLPPLPAGCADVDVRARFAFDSKEPLTYISPAERGCVSTERHTLALDSRGTMPVKPDTFDCDTYMFDRSQLRRVDLLDAAGSPYVSVEFDAPLVALWAPTATKPDCPFVCIEPWYGRADAVGYNGDWEHREHMNVLAPGHTFKASYRITIH